jgi:hypothetical protein
MFLVSPVPGGWSVDCPATDNVLVFASGGRAEQAARNLGSCLAGLGHDIRVAVHDRHGVLIGTAHYFPVQEPKFETPASRRLGAGLAVT